MKTKTLIIILGILLVLTGANAFGYYVLKTNITNKTVTETTNTSIPIKVSYSAKTIQNSDLAVPGDKIIKEIQVIVTPGTDIKEAKYDIYLNITNNTFEKCTEINNDSTTNNCVLNAQELTYKLIDKNSQSEIATGDITGITGKKVLKTETKTVSTETTYTYNLEIQYADTTQDQNHNQDAVFSGEVEVSMTA